MCVCVCVCVCSDIALNFEENDFSESKRSFTPDAAWYGTVRRGAAVQCKLCNAYKKFQRESGDGGAVLFRAASRGAERRCTAPLRTVPYRAVPDSV